jgi:hypothetical protein
LRGALATKQSRGRVMPPLDCFAALAMTGGELARLFLGVALVRRLPAERRLLLSHVHRLERAQRIGNGSNSLGYNV